MGSNQRSTTGNKGRQLDYSLESSSSSASLESSSDEESLIQTKLLAAPTVAAATAMDEEKPRADETLDMEKGVASLMLSSDHVTAGRGLAHLGGCVYWPTF